MKQVYLAKDLVEAQMLKDFLSDQKIEVIVKGEFLMGAVGEIPADTSPSVWVVDEKYFDQARELVQLFGNQSIEPVSDSVWKCLQCDELIEPQFSECWKCGKTRD